MIFINESNLYRIILRSNLPAAEKFESWVCDEVLPAIRRNGQYQMVSAMFPNNLQLGQTFTNLMLRELLKVDNSRTRNRMAGLVDFYVSQIR